MNTWLIEVNENPALATSGTLLSRLIPNLMENTFKIAVDPIFPPPNYPKSKKHMIPDFVYTNNKFELIFDELSERDALLQMFNNYNNGTKYKVYYYKKF